MSNSSLLNATINIIAEENQQNAEHNESIDILITRGDRGVKTKN